MDDIVIAIDNVAPVTEFYIYADFFIVVIKKYALTANGVCEHVYISRTHRVKSISVSGLCARLTAHPTKCIFKSN